MLQCCPPCKLVEGGREVARERERERERERVCVCVYYGAAFSNAQRRERERESVCVCVYYDAAILECSTPCKLVEGEKERECVSTYTYTMVYPSMVYI